MEKGCKKKATNNNRKIQILVVICRGMLGKMLQKRLQKEGPKSQILVLFDVSKHRKHNAKLENPRGGFRSKSVRGVANFGWLTEIEPAVGQAKGSTFAWDGSLGGRLNIKD